MLYNIFYGRSSIQNIFSLLYYTKKGITQKMIHELKYKNREEIGVFFGQWIAYELKNTSRFTNIDYIIPVPLHSTRYRERGYNQLTKFGKTLSKQLKIPYKSNLLIRKSKAKKQALKKQLLERFTDNHSKFDLVNPSFLNNKHVLLIDDVITTGATIDACCVALLKANSITISVCSIAYAKK
jgi:ComF family protein